MQGPWKGAADKVRTLTAAGSRRMNDSDHQASFEDHLHLPGLAEQLASQTDAYLRVDRLRTRALSSVSPSITCIC